MPVDLSASNCVARVTSHAISRRGEWEERERHRRSMHLRGEREREVW
jgi:hypothetical protein